MTPHETLGVSPDASPDEVNRAYRALARRHHPDRNPGDADAEAAFKRVQDAYDKIRGRHSGEDKKRGDAVDLAASVFTQVLAKVFQEKDDPSRHDLIAIVKKSLEESLRPLREAIFSLKAAKAKMIKLQGRFKSKKRKKKADGAAVSAEFFEAIVAREIAQMDLEIARNQEMVNVRAMAVEIVSDVSFDVEKATVNYVAATVVYQ